MHGPYLKQSQTGVYNFGTVCEQPAVDGRSVATITNKVPYVLQLEPSPLRLPMVHSSSSPAFSLLPRPRGPALPFTYKFEANWYMSTFNFRENIYAHLKIWYMAASKHTHASCNAVPLVWGSLRLTPIINTYIY